MSKVDDLLVERAAKGVFWLKHRDGRKWEEALPTIREAHREYARLALQIIERRMAAI